MMNRTTSQANQNRLSHSRGAGSFGCFFFILLILILAFLALRFGEAGWDYLQVRQKTKEALSWAVAGKDKNHTEIVQKVINNVLEEGIELSPGNIRVKETNDLLIITVSWVREIDLIYSTYPLQLNFSLNDVKRWRRGGLIIK